MNFIHPEKIIPLLQISEGMKIADLGCGAGFFTILLAKAVGENGEIFAADVQKSSLESVKIKAQAEKISNIKTIWADLEIYGTTKIADDSLDMVLISDVLFQSKKKGAIIKEAWRIVSPNGKLAIIDWKPESLEIGPKNSYRLAKNDMIKIAEETGFKLTSEFDASDYHYGLFFSKE